MSKTLSVDPFYVDHTILVYGSVGIGAKLKTDSVLFSVRVRNPCVS